MTSEKLLNYVPQHPEYVIDGATQEEFPMVLNFKSIPNEELTTKRDAMRYIGRYFAATFPDEYVTRKMDAFEKAAIREEYCKLVENDLPERKRQLEEALEEAKRMKKEAEERYSSSLQEVAAMAAEVRMGTIETRLRGTDTFCIAIAGYYLFYTWNEADAVFQLAKATPCSDASLWSSDEKNREMMLQLFGVEFPEREEIEKGDEINAF